MATSGKYKAEAALDREGLSAWLRGLADALDAGELATDTGPLALEGFKGLKISFKAGWPQGYAAKLSVKFPRPALAPGEDPADEEGGEEAMPKYSSLKKHMKYTFKAIGQALAAGQLPPLQEARSFLADSRLMCAYSGKGDEYYAHYLDAVQAFEQALEQSDLEALGLAYGELARLKRECHSRHA
ncbi:hypothetical protein NNJEOMEG_03587 [Fundidesulfovibrio magnetotacticus]|uniref:Uncharacterized protein n=1 Tax=Fundidesulfovibrio magnetotacticus TaxID=2730080 RepID=A0A6V8M0F1_9BACT|nr:GAK system XXXCH domain-containing protein [Fundidesulfovibrio magnetotacticus]GFK95719.1 hypothetical protein NNJEOMEG_03587 [Fundidesulfovibrio magnetotacticus]